MSEPRFCTLVPIGGQIIVKRDPPKTRTEGGILLPESSRQARAKCVQTAVVIRKGPGFIHPGSGKPVQVSEKIVSGVRVVLNEYAGTDYEHEEAHGREVYTILQEAEVLCIRGGIEERFEIPAAATEQAVLDEANALAAEQEIAQRSDMEAQMKARAQEIANGMLGRSPGGVRLH